MTIIRTTTLYFVLVTVTVIFIMVNDAPAAEPPVKLVPSSHIGWEVDETTKGNTCTVVSEDQCQHAIPNSEPGGFEYPESVTSAPTGNVYVTDRGNHRVQELTAKGELVLMFGKEVNATTHDDICTEEEIETSLVKCQPGAMGIGTGAFAEPQGIAVDPLTENVYVQDYANWRIDEYTATGQFVLMIGKEVNQTKDNTPGAAETEKNLCTAISKDTCTAGVQSTPESKEKGAFNFAQLQGNLLAVGGAPEHILYVGDEHRVQEFDATGKWKDEIKLPTAIIAPIPNGHITAIAADNQTVYIVYQFESIIHEFTAATGEPLQNNIEDSSREEHGTVEIREIALDASNRLAVTANEGLGTQSLQFGSLYKANDGVLLTRFTIFGIVGSESITGLSFSEKGELYGTVRENHEITSYTPEPVAELRTGPGTCEEGHEQQDASVTFDCTLNGEVNPYNIVKTEVWFESGRTCSLGTLTLKQPIETVETLLQISGLLEGLRPHETFCYRLAGNDQNVEPPEELNGEKAIFSTPTVPPRLVGLPTASFIKTSSAILYGELNPENTTTQYYFEYAPELTVGENTLTKCPGTNITTCPGVSTTSILQSSLYGKMNAILEATGLQPNTSYHYRLTAHNESGEPPPSTESTFTTQPVQPSPPEGSSPPPATEAPPYLSPPLPATLLTTPKIRFPIRLPACKRSDVRDKNHKCVKAKKKTKTGRHRKRVRKKNRT